MCISFHSGSVLETDSRFLTDSVSEGIEQVNPSLNRVSGITIDGFAEIRTS